MPTNLEIETHILELVNILQVPITDSRHDGNSLQARTGNSWHLPMFHSYFNSTGKIIKISFAIKAVGETDTFGDLQRGLQMEIDWLWTDPKGAPRPRPRMYLLQMG